jgi:hypothetical protein
VKQRLCIVVLLAGCPSGSEDDTADTSTGVAETGPVEIHTAAEWNTGDPATDIDGDPRPDVAGTADVAGADLVS